MEAGMRICTKPYRKAALNQILTTKLQQPHMQQFSALQQFLYCAARRFIQSLQGNFYNQKVYSGLESNSNILSTEPSLLNPSDSC